MLFGIHVIIIGISIVTGIDVFAFVVSGTYLLDVQVPTIKLIEHTVSILVADPFTALKVIENALVNCYKDVINYVYNYYCPNVDALKGHKFVLPSQYIDHFGHYKEYSQAEYEQGGYYYKDAVINRELRTLTINRVIGTVLIIYWLGCAINGLSHVN